MLSFVEPLCREYCSQDMYRWLGNRFWAHLFQEENDWTPYLVTGAVAATVLGGVAYRLSRPRAITAPAPVNTTPNVSSPVCTQAATPVEQAAKPAAQEAEEPVFIPQREAMPVLAVSVAQRVRHLNAILPPPPRVEEPNVITEKMLVDAYIQSLGSEEARNRLRRMYYQCGSSGKQNALAQVLRAGQFASTAAIPAAHDAAEQGKLQAAYRAWRR